MIDTVKITGKILLLSGLHIGGSDIGVKIGGIDTPVIKNPISGLPYIPGSSLKGKIRFLLEHYYNVVPNDGGVSRTTHNGQKNIIPVIFGHIEKDAQTMPTRVIFRDSNVIGALDTLENLNSEELDNHLMSIAEAEQAMNTKFVEGKTEVSIDRKTGTVNTRQGGPRQIERVPAGSVFDLEIVLRIFVQEEKDHHLEVITKGLKLLENDALGGFGSRGSGRIKLYDLKMGEEPLNLAAVTL